MVNNDRENRFIESFIATDKRDRYRSLLANPRKRAKILDLLNHSIDLDWSLAREVKASELESALVALSVKSQDCYLISDCSELDGSTVTLTEGLRLGEACRSGTVLDCVPGRLAVHWNELGPNRRCYLLVRAEKQRA